MAAPQLFQKRGFGGNGAALRSLGKPPAAFPARVATDADLMIAVDRQQTNLTSSIGVSDTSMTVVDPSSIVAYSLLSIDNEIVKTTGPPAGNVVPISRGFDGTTPAIHLASATVAGLIDAYHHNGLVAEVEAIETALGANLSKVPGSAWISSSNYNFAPQTPGGSLIVGNNTITLSPVPAGINGSNTNHRVYISGGTGTAEAALITGGSAVSGAASGTLIVQCANTHSGAWTIQSATAGIQEAINSVPGVVAVLVPSGTYTVWGTITIAKYGVTVMGEGMGSSILTCASGAADVFVITGANQVTVKDLSIVGSGKTGSCWAFNTSNTGYLTLSNLWIDFIPNGFNLYLNTVAFIHDINLRDLTTSSIGIALFGGNDQVVSGVVMDWDGTNYYYAGIEITASGGAHFNNIDVIHGTYGLLVNPPAGATVIEVTFNQAWFDTTKNACISIQPVSTGAGAAAGVQGLWFTDCWASTSGGNGVETGGTGTYRDLNFKGLLAFGNANYGVSIGAQGNVNISHSTIAANSQSSTGGFPNIAVSAGASNWRIQNSTIGGPYYTLAERSSYAILILGGSGDSFSVLGNLITAGTVGTINDQSTGTHARIEGNVGYNPVGLTAITVGASPFTYRAGHSPEVVYITGGTVSNINRGGAGVPGGSSPATIPLPPNGTVTVTYTAAPSMIRDVL